jgi:nitroimidazol reductase NimA-like FMN-containing flavoprotein (pyridoxamine 5'-phosphate oxidase superfamily)
MEYEKSELNKIERGKHKASYDKKLIHSILDSSEICSVAFNFNGKAFVQPINFGRSGDTLYLHGSHQNRMTTALLNSGEVCLSVFYLDSMKLTRSAFHHSVNYRSVVVFGKVRELNTNEEKLIGLKAIINHFVPNRWDYCRVPNENELKATRVLAIDIKSASAKIADAAPQDNMEDYELNYWSGEIPIKTICEFPIPDKKLKEGISIPQHVLDFYENRKNGF